MFIFSLFFLEVLVVVVQSRCSTATYCVNSRQEEQKLSYQSENFFACNL